MIERNNPAIDVDDVMARIHRDIARRRFGTDAELLADVSASKLDAAVLESHLAVAQARAEVRSMWSERLNVFPFSVFRGLQRTALRAFALLFKDQRHVNFALIAGLRETLEINRELHERIGALERRLHRLESSPRAGSPE
jgi:hypothetical protein